MSRSVRTNISSVFSDLFLYGLIAAVRASSAEDERERRRRFS